MSILLHGHHANDERCPLSFGMNTAERVNEIETHKPEAERPLRLLLLREVDPDELPVEGCEADARWQEARAKGQEAGAKWQEADAKWREAYATTDWDAWHREHCGGVAADVCKWTAKHPSIF